MERFQAEGTPVFLPEVSLPHIIDYLLEVGPTMPSGLGPAPLTHVELRAWQADMAIELSPFEAQTLRRLSRVWITHAQRSEAADCPAPYGYTGPGRAAVAKKIDEAFG